MARVKFVRDSAGIGQILVSREFQQMVTDAARSVASHCGGTVSSFTSGASPRATASVRVRARRQVRDGALTRAASASGLSVRPK